MLSEQSEYVLDLRSPNWQSNGSTYYWDSMGQAGPVPEHMLRSGDLAQIEANWGAIVFNENSVQLSCDLVRSRAIFYARLPGDQDGRWLISDSPAAMREWLPSWERDEAAAEVFGLAGYTLNERTLIRGVSIVEAASTVMLRWNSATAQIGFWGVPLYLDDPVGAQRFTRYYERSLDVALGALLERAGQRQLVLPLSGGLDSRLLAVWLRRLNAPNMLAFTYGKAGSHEAQVAQRVAESLNIPFVWIELDADSVREQWFAEGADGFRADTWNASTLPHIQDWFALTALKQRGTIADDAILLPGHTVVGAMHNLELLQGATGSDVARALAAHHGVSHPGRRSLLEAPEFRRAVQRAFGQVPAGPRRVQNVVEWFNFRERQAKYINNSMAGYEHFGWDWALPLYWPAPLQAWFSGPEELTADRAWYREFVDRAFTEATGEAPASYFAPPAESSGIPMRELVVQVARKTGLNKLISRLWELKVEADHPLALEAFSTASSKSGLLADLLSDGTLRGTWARDFLQNRWGSPAQSLLPPVERGQQNRDVGSGKPRLLIISHSNLEKDARIRKQIALFEGDYDVTVCGYGQPFKTRAELMLHHAADTIWTDRLRALLLRARLYRLAERFEADNRAARRLLRQRNFDVVIANDIEPVGMAVDLFGGTRVHADLHEYYPGLQDHDPAWVRLRQPYYEWMLNNRATLAASATTVSKSIAERYSRDFGFDCEVVENARPFLGLSPTPVHAPIRLVHAGAALPNRRIEEMMRAAAQAGTKVTMDFFLTGEGTEYYRSLVALTESLGQRIRLRAPVAQDQLIEVLNGYDVGVHILPPTATNHSLALPNKFFDFVQARLGVIVGPTAEMASRVRRFGIGAITDGFEVEDLVRVIEALDPGLVQEWKANTETAARALDVTDMLEVWRRAVNAIVEEQK